jgi:hypothetical protein
MLGGMSTLASAIREQIRRLTAGQEALEEIERSVIDPCPLSEDEKCALWLYAWSAPGRPSPALRLRVEASGPDHSTPFRAR